MDLPKIVGIDVNIEEIRAEERKLERNIYECMD